MPKSTVLNRLTAKQVEKFKLSAGKKEEILRDGGSLELRVRPTATGESKVWQFPFRFDGKRESIYIGVYPAITLLAAREIAAGYRRQIAEGKNPKALIEQDESVAHANKLAAVHGDAPDTFGELFERWHRLYLSNQRDDGGASVKSLFDMHILPNGMAELKLSLLLSTHISPVLDRIKATGQSRTTGLALDLIRQMVHWAAPFGWIQLDPTLGLKKRTWGAQTVKRDRKLTEAEVTQLHWRLKKSSLKARWKHAIWLILATGTRIEETVLTERSHIDLAARTWSIPPENQKTTNSTETKVTHVIHLSDFALKHVKALLAMPGNERYLFPARARKGSNSELNHADEKTVTKAVKTLQGGTQKGRRNSTELLLKGGPWKPHDLRRTMSTLMQELRVDSITVNKCQNHVIPDQVQRIYLRAELEQMQKEAWDILGIKLSELTQKPDPEPDYVAPKPKAIFFDETDLEAVAQREKKLMLVQLRKSAVAKTIQLQKSRRRPNQSKKQAVNVANVDFEDSLLI